MTLLLDPDIRDWVVLPLFVIMVAAGLLRHHIGVVLQGSKQPIPVIAQRGQNVLMQTRRIRSGASHYISTWQWHARKQHYIALLQEEATWAEAEQQKKEDSGSEDPMEAMMNNPLGMLQGNMAFMVQKYVRSLARSLALLFL
jgi:ER membrane protein complex subunit 3